MRPHPTREAEWYKGKKILRKPGCSSSSSSGKLASQVWFLHLYNGDESNWQLRTVWGLREWHLCEALCEHKQEVSWKDSPQDEGKSHPLLRFCSHSHILQKRRRAKTHTAVRTRNRTDRWTLTCPAPPAGFSADGLNPRGQGGHPSPQGGPAGVPAFLWRVLETQAATKTGLRFV